MASHLQAHLNGFGGRFNLYLYFQPLQTTSTKRFRRQQSNADTIHLVRLQDVPCSVLTSIILIPETQGRSLEEMDIIFGSISVEKRGADIDKRQRGTRLSKFFVAINGFGILELNCVFSHPSG